MKPDFELQVFILNDEEASGSFRMSKSKVNAG